ncbi:MAG: N-acyl-D-glucosamine 2-epimerase [Frankiales bacterium]|nr:N-acyl-D-glucosamine 2-epimerase [Frankiales bacterium]
MAGTRDHAAHVAWLGDETRRLLDFARGSLHPTGGFARLDDTGNPQLQLPVETWITGRMTHVFAIGSLLGEPDTARLVDHGVTSLLDWQRDAANGGWHSSVDGAGGATTDRKEAYQHAFVILAAASAVAAGRPRADELLQKALTDYDEHFWEPAHGAFQESFATDWSDPEDYRGANSNMHAVEALLAAYDATGDAKWRDRALSIARLVVEKIARAFDWRIVEHFDVQWQPLPDYNIDSPSDPFRPYALTVGHWLEWSRLMLHLEAALDEPPTWLAEAARSLFDNSMRYGWSADGADGFVYTVDWSNEPVVRTRMHWVAAEGIAVAAALHTRFGDQRYADVYAELWDYSRRHLLDVEHGSWHHELDEQNRPIAVVWPGKPDVYHAFQATLIPRLPLAPTLSAALRAGRLDTVEPPAGPEKP